MVKKREDKNMKKIMDFDKLFGENGEQMTIFSKNFCVGDYSINFNPKRSKTDKKIPIAEMNDIRLVYAYSYPDNHNNENDFISFNNSDDSSADGKHRFFTSVSAFLFVLLVIVALSILL